MRHLLITMMMMMMGVASELGSVGSVPGGRGLTVV